MQSPSFLGGISKGWNYPAERSFPFSICPFFFLRGTSAYREGHILTSINSLSDLKNLFSLFTPPISFLCSFLSVLGPRPYILILGSLRDLDVIMNIIGTFMTRIDAHHRNSQYHKRLQLDNFPGSWHSYREAIICQSLFNPTAEHDFRKSLLSRANHWLLESRTPKPRSIVFAMFWCREDDEMKVGR
jgi:hypothetical protein